MTALLAFCQQPAFAATYTWWFANAKSQQMLYEPATSRSFSRTGVSAELRVHDSAFQITAWIGSVSATGARAASVSLGYLNTQPTRARWVYLPYPAEQGLVQTKVMLTGVPTGGMSAPLDANEVVTQAEKKLGSRMSAKSVQVGSVEATLLTRSSDASYWTLKDEDGNQHLVADYGDFVSSVHATEEEFMREGLLMVVNDGHGDKTTLLLPAGFEVNADKSPLSFRRAASGLFLAQGSAQRDTIVAVNSGGALLKVPTFTTDNEGSR